MVASNIEIVYVEAHGVVEPARLILADAGIPFKNTLLNMDEWRANQKNDTSQFPVGQIPVLHYDGVIIPESLAIFKFLAAECGYVPRDNLKLAYADGICSMLDDINAKGYRPARDTQDDPEALKKWFAEGSKVSLTKFQDWVNKISGGKGFIVGTEEITFADIKFYDLFHWYTSIYSKVLDPYPRLKSLYETIGARPNLKTYCETKRSHLRGGPTVAKIL